MSEKNTDIAAFETVDKEIVKKQILTVRGCRVMLDVDIAVYFGVETGALNRAMKRNIKRFPPNFCFQLTKEELEDLKCQSGISSDYESHGGRRTLPYAYTEQGVAMLTSALHTDRAISASIQIMEAFVEMSHFIWQNRQLLPPQELLRLSGKQAFLEGEVRDIKENMVTKADLSDFIKLFDSGVEHDEILILDGEPFKADLAYQKIYRRAKRKIMVIDDYISTKTLQHLLHSKTSVKLTIISDNKARPPLRKTEYADFQKENPGRSIDFITTTNKAHDRYIILDQGTKDMKVYHCGASSKDAGKKITTITQVKDISNYKEMVKELTANPPLVLR